MRIAFGLLASAALALASMPAAATPYMFSTNSLTNFTVNAPNPGAAVTQATAEVQPTAQLPIGSSDPLVPAPACVGAPCPGVNNPAPQGPTGSFLRAGARMALDSQGRFSELDNHAESFFAVGGTAIGVNRFQMPFTVTDPLGFQLDISFDAAPYMQVALDAGDSGPASATLQFSLAIQGVSNGFSFTWRPEELNQVITAVAPGQTVLYNDIDANPTTFDPLAMFFARSVVLPQGDYTLALVAVECFDCPEPATWTVLGMGLVGLGQFRRRRRAGPGTDAADGMLRA